MASYGFGGVRMAPSAWARSNCSALTPEIAMMRAHLRTSHAPVSFHPGQATKHPSDTNGQYVDPGTYVLGPNGACHPTDEKQGGVAQYTSSLTMHIPPPDVRGRPATAMHGH